MLNSVRFLSLWSSWEGQDFCRIFWSGNWWSPNCQSSRASEFTRERHQSVQTVRTLNVNELNKNKTKAAIIFSFKLFILSCSESGSARCLSRSRSQDSSVAPCCEQVCRMGKGTLRARWRQKGSVEISWKNDRLENCFECFQCDRPSSRGRQVTQPHNGAKAPRNSSERRFYNFSTSKCLELCEACEACEGWSCRVFCRWIGVDKCRHGAWEVTLNAETEEWAKHCTHVGRVKLPPAEWSFDEASKDLWEHRLALEKCWMHRQDVGMVTLERFFDGNDELYNLV